MGLIQTITWTIDHTYTDIIISEDSGLLFNWNGPTPHNLIEMSSPQSTSEHCTYVGSNAAALGKVSTYTYTYNQAVRIEIGNKSKVKIGFFKCMVSEAIGRPSCHPMPL